VSKDEQDNDDRAQSKYPIGYLIAGYRRFSLQPFHALPPRSGRLSRGLLPRYEALPRQRRRSMWFLSTPGARWGGSGGSPSRSSRDEFLLPSEPRIPTQPIAEARIS
jgi:hypothetical protein